MNETDRKSRRVIAEAQEGETTVLFVVVIVMAAILLAFAAWVLPRPAHAAEVPTATIKRTVDICAIEVPKSWTKGLQKKANRAFDQKVKVVRTTEYKLADQPCDIYVSTSGVSRTVILSDAHAAEWEVTATAATKKQRPAAIVNMLRSLGVR